MARQLRRPGFGRSALLSGLLWIVTAVVVYLLLSGGSGHDVARRAASVSGIVTSVEPANHEVVRAQYIVDGRQYEVASSFVGPPNPRFDDIKVGDRVIVFYDKDAPDKAVLADPTERAQSEEAFATVGAIFVATAVLVLVLGNYSFWRLFRSAWREGLSSLFPASWRR